MGSLSDLGMRWGSSYLYPLSRFLLSPCGCVGTETQKGVVGRSHGREVWPKQLASPEDLCWARPALPLAVPLSRAATPLGPRMPWSLSCPRGRGQTCGLGGWAGPPQLPACTPPARASQAEHPQLGEAEHPLCHPARTCPESIVPSSPQA